MAFPFPWTLSPSKHLLPGLLLTTALAPVSAATLCDLNNDGTVTRTDLDIIFQARGHSVITPFDPLDIDRNGVINSSDARLCACKLPTTAACEREPNLPPQAVPGNDQTVEQVTFSIIILDGEESSDPEGDPLSYLWHFEQRPVGSQARLFGADSARPDFVPDRYGDYRMALTVTDAFGLNSTEQVTVTVSLIAVDDRHTTIQQDSSGNIIHVLLNNTNSDEDTLSIISVTDPTHGIAVNNSRNVGYTPDAGFVGEDSFSYMISDSNGHTATASVTITVSPDEIVRLGQRPIEQCIREQLKLSSIDEPTRQQLESITSVSCEDRNIKDISPLTNLTSLTFLDLWGDQIADISPLANLTSLTSLNLSSTQIANLSSLANLTSLTNLGLTLFGTQIADISPLTNLTSLTSLHLSGTQKADLSPLANLTSLTSLNLFGNQVADLSPLANLTSLTSLHLSLFGTQRTDISPLANLTSLTSFHLGGTQIADLSPLANLTSLTDLSLYYSQIADISPLANLTLLTDLRLSNNQIADISPLARLVSLTFFLDLRDNQIADLSPLTNLTSLTGLNLHSNQIADISPLTNLTSLTNLSLDNNRITDFTPVSHVTTVTGQNSQIPAP